MDKNIFELSNSGSPNSESSNSESINSESTNSGSTNSGSANSDVTYVGSRKRKASAMTDHLGSLGNETTEERTDIVNSSEQLPKKIGLTLLMREKNQNIVWPTIDEECDHDMPFCPKRPRLEFMPPPVPRNIIGSSTSLQRRGSSYTTSNVTGISKLSILRNKSRMLPRRPILSRHSLVHRNSIPTSGGVIGLSKHSLSIKSRMKLVAKTKSRRTVIRKLFN